MSKIYKTLNIFLLLATTLCYSPLAFCETLITAELIDHIEHLYKGSAKDRMQAWVNLVKTHANDNELDKLKIVNAFFNKFVYRTDLQQYGISDFWMTPVEFLSKGGGDCEDYAISKYFTLEAVGVAQDKLRITYVTYLVQNVAHMVLTYYPTPGAMPLVLDNINPIILTADKRTDLKPIYSFNGDGLWQSVQRNQGRKIGESSKITLWDELNVRMNRELEGIQKG